MEKYYFHKIVRENAVLKVCHAAAVDAPALRTKVPNSSRTYLPAEFFKSAQ
jgi:hypothetical protein